MKPQMIIMIAILLTNMSCSYEIIQTSGTYTCDTCSTTQEWYIEKNHILYWDGKPYVPYAINDYPLDYDNVDEIKEAVYFLFNKGVPDFKIFSYEMDIPINITDQLNAKKQLADYITQLGGTFIFGYGMDWIISQLGDDRSIEFMLQEETRQAFRDDLRTYRNIVATPGLRAVEFNGELNGLDKIEGTPEELATKLGTVLSIYGTIVKEEIGDVPVIIGLAEPFTGFTNLLQYLPGLDADNIDGVNMQIHGGMPEDVRFHAERLLITRLLNSSSKTKLFWGYSQAVPLGSFVLFRSQQLMHDSYMAMIEAGMTGFVFDQFSSFGFIEYGMGYDSEELRNQNKEWWGVIKPALKSEILQRAQNNEFSSGEWIVPIEPDELKPKSPKFLNEEQVSDIVQNYPDVIRLSNLGAELFEPMFNSDYGIWQIFIGGDKGMPWFLWIDDSNEGTVLFDGITLLDDARNAGYPIPSDEWLISFATSIDKTPKGVPQELVLNQNYPNSFNPSTTIE